MTTTLRWRKASRSQNGGTCVELAHTLNALRDSKNPDGPTLTVPHIAALIGEIKHGRFDR